MASAEFSHRINITATSIPAMNTASCFNVLHTEIIKSPIDSCFQKLNSLNLIHIKFSSISAISQDVLITQNNLILLGYISAVESYLREIVRKLILLDKSSRIGSLSQQLSYGAAINYPSHLLPEALLEKASYASKVNIIETFKTFLGIKGHTPNELELALDEFEKICHFRHCIVHRFGKLGSSNAIKFGIDDHTSCLEKPLSLDAPKLYNAYQICENTVLVINHYLFSKILFRTLSPDLSPWQWDFRKDKKHFSKYYDLFSSSVKGDPTSTVKNAYEDLKKAKLGL